MTGVFLDPAGLPRPRFRLVGFFLPAAFLESLVLPGPDPVPVPAPLARKTRTGPSVLDRELPESAEVTAVFIRLFLPLVRLVGSGESGDGLAASVESPAVLLQRRALETSSSSGSMPLLFNCYDPCRLVLLVSYKLENLRATYVNVT